MAFQSSILSGLLFELSWTITIIICINRDAVPYEYLIQILEAEGANHWLVNKGMSYVDKGLTDIYL